MRHQTGSMTERGKFITVEGIEGAGKSSNLAYIRELLDSAGKKHIFTREPGGTELGEDIRRLLLDHKHSGMGNDAELLLIFGARAEHIESVINPALKEGVWVLCDRFTDASYAYQGGGRGIDRERIRSLEQWVQGDLRPDLTLLLDLPVETGLARAGNRSEPDRFEVEHRSFFDGVRKAYLEIAGMEPERVRVIDASLSVDRVRGQIETVLGGYLSAGNP